MRLAKCFQVVPTAKMLEVRIGNDKIGCEHGRGDLAAVGAVANEGVDESRLLGWLKARR